MKVDKFLDILNYIACTILSVSIFLMLVPVFNEIFRSVVLYVQVFIIFYLHNALNSKKPYYLFTSLLGASNLIVCIIIAKAWIKSSHTLENIPQIDDIFSSVTLQVSYDILHFFYALIFIITAFVVIECIVSVIIKRKKFKSI